MLRDISFILLNFILPNLILLGVSLLLCAELWPLSNIINKIGRRRETVLARAFRAFMYNLAILAPLTFLY
jgi:hypothetical protein